MYKEDVELEFKREKTATYLKTVSAFANYRDGEIRFGMGDDGTVYPIENQSQFALDIENQINDTITPQPTYEIKLNNNGTISLFVKKGSSTPYFYNGKAYKRNGTSTIEVDSIELKRLILEGENIEFDELPFKGELSFNYLSNKLKETVGLTSFNDDTLRTLELLTPNGYNNAASLLSDNNKFGGVEIVVFGDDENTLRERIDLSGLSLLEQFDKSMEVFSRYYVEERIDGALRKEVELVPLVAFREMIANAIVHRTYDIPANTKVAMYKNKIVINSPGGLMFGLSEEQFLRGAFSLLRNSIVANVFKRVKIIEAFATGIDRTLRSYFGKKVIPYFESDEHSILVSLPVDKNDINATFDQKSLLNKLSSNVKYSRKELEKISGYDKSKTIRLLNRLVDNGLLGKEGEGRSTVYFKK